MEDHHEWKVLSIKETNHLKVMDQFVIVDKLIVFTPSVYGGNVYHIGYWQSFFSCNMMVTYVAM